ncbi:hypothetical protein [Pseudoalteromonas luteoviolacea]|uniref:hypothetical protein n=1 Tax=Pseudoalteromonas luteoviolacea TaxID=43657 RepID=UPI001153CB55|nr:hypothetical protein [Pseudoalteromonas luteoviolacea]TQF70057.1 hypothetical protein FLM44_02895 [Pseudoalteromonas luteoviolacea]
MANKIGTFSTALVMVGLLSTSQLAVAGQHKLNIKNTFPTNVKVKWFCKGKHKDSDTYPIMQGKTRQLNTDKCENENDLTIQFYVKTFLGWMGPKSRMGWWGIDYYGQADQYAHVRTIKYGKLPGKKNSKRCIVIAPDPIWAATGWAWPAAFEHRNC